MRHKFSELYWGIFFLALLAFLAVFGFIRNFIKEIFGENIKPVDVSPYYINIVSWLITFLVIFLIVTTLIIFLWRNQIKVEKSNQKNMEIAKLPSKKNKPV